MNPYEYHEQKMFVKKDIPDFNKNDNLDLYGKALDELNVARNIHDEAEINYESALAHAIVDYKQSHGSTLAKDIAKSSLKVIEAKRSYQEAERKVKSLQAQLTLLQNKIDWEKLQIRAGMNVDGGPR